jgi:predicted PurR-regulated permease PerM
MELEIPTRTLVKVVAFAAAVWLLVELWFVVVIVGIALIIAGTLNPLVAWLEARRMPRALALVVIFIGLLAVVFLLGLITIPPLVGQLVSIMEKAPALQGRLADDMTHSRLLRPLAASVRGFRLAEYMGMAGQLVLAWSSQIAFLVGEVATTIFLAFYIIAEREREKELLYSVVPLRYHPRLERILERLEVIVGGYVRGQVITSILILVFTFGLLSVFDVPNALAIAVFAAATDVIPFIGGLLVTTPAVLATLGAAGIPAAVGVLVAMILYQEFESRILVPRVYGRVLRLSPATVLVALLAGATLLGIVGALLALPVAAAVRMIVKELRAEAVEQKLEVPPE